MRSSHLLVTTALVVLLTASACGDGDFPASRTPGEETEPLPAATTPVAMTTDPGVSEEAAAGTAAESGRPGYAFSTTGAVEVEGDGVLIGWSAMEGEPGVAIIGFISGLDIVSIRFPEDFTVGQPIDLTADYTSGSGPNVDIVLDRQSFDEEIVSGALTVTANEGEAITGTFEVTGRGDQGGQVTVTGTFTLVPRE